MDMLPERIQNLENNKRVVFNTRLNDWRVIRDKKLKELDFEFMLALEELVKDLPGDKTKINAIIEKKKALRDVTLWNEFNKISDEIEMMDYLPEILK